jgi:predicted acylesterase/phospholipase RssA
MKRRPQSKSSPAVCLHRPLNPESSKLAIVLSGGGSRAAYQVGALKALVPYLEENNVPITTIIGSSIGAINGLILASCLKEGLAQAIVELESLWRERTFRNTFNGSPSRAFFRAIVVASAQLRSPGPSYSDSSIFDPSPLMNRLDNVIEKYGGLKPEDRHPGLEHVAVMTTLEGTERKPLLFLSSHKKVEDDALRGATFGICYFDNLTAKHGFASAALPHILPPVEIDTEKGVVRLVDGGISQNLPVDPAVRLGAQQVLLLDCSGRDWWLDHYREPHDTRPTWEVPAAPETFCMRPDDYFVGRCQRPLGPVLKESVGSSTRKFIRAVGPVWPLFSLLKKKLGEEVAYEVMSYVALDTDYINHIIERGFYETTKLLKERSAKLCLRGLKESEPQQEAS